MVAKDALSNGSAMGGAAAVQRVAIATQAAPNTVIHFESSLDSAGWIHFLHAAHDKVTSLYTKNAVKSNQNAMLFRLKL